MEKIGLFYGSDTGYTEAVAFEIVGIIGKGNIDCHEVSKVSSEMFANYSFIIIGLSTWHDGQLQSDWDAFYEEFKRVDFTGKTVALFGLGDQVGYGEYFIDGIGILGEVVFDNGGEIVGVWPTDGYDIEASKAVFQEGWFLGLALDEDNQSHLTMERIQVWLEQVLEEFKERMKFLEAK
jgi:flavodoxin I